MGGKASYEGPSAEEQRLRSEARQQQWDLEAEEKELLALVEAENVRKTAKKEELASREGVGGVLTSGASGFSGGNL